MDLRCDEIGILRWKCDAMKSEMCDGDVMECDDIVEMRWEYDAMESENYDGMRWNAMIS